LKIESISCTSWPEFKGRVISDQFSNGQFERGKFLFRGQGGESWPLTSSFDRWYGAYGGNRANKTKVAEQLLDGFLKECELEDIPQHVRQDRLLMLSMAQHNGLPTRLLDWSESPYVAAFFAFSGHIRHGTSTETHVAIWVLDSTQDIWNADFGCNIVTVPSFGNERVRNQHGRFTHLKTPSDSLEDYVAQFPGDVIAFKKYLVPVSEAGVAMADLDSMGLNHARIYPGLSGNAKAAEVRVILGMYKA
jgi:hypothetical protein